MPIRGTRECNQLSQELERMGDGVATHNGEEHFPSKVVATDSAKTRGDLEDLRGTYERLQGETDRAYGAFRAAAVRSRRSHRSAKRMLAAQYSVHPLSGDVYYDYCEACGGFTRASFADND